jgi:hypothetical protein
MNAQGNKYAVVAVEYFTRWIETKPLVNTAVAGLKRFFWQNIICHFGVPKEIVDNAKQFDCHIFKYFCHRMGVEAAFASLYHAPSNGAVEKANAFDIHSHKEDTRESVERQMGRRIAESSMEPQYFHLQSYKIHPLKLLYGEEPVTPEEIKLPSTRTKTQAMYRLSEAKCKDLLELERMKAVKNLQSYQSEIRAWRDKKVKLKHIEPGHLVLL